ncbi:MAG: uroporphyrinogen-III synthase [Thermoplasmatales archaeon]
MANNVAYVGTALDKSLAGVIEIPVLRISYRDISYLGKIETPIAIMSKRAVISLKMSGVSMGTSRIYCIGEETAKYLNGLYSLDCFVPELQNTEGLAGIIVSKEKRITIIGSNRTSTRFITNLENKGVEVRHIAAYNIEENEDVSYADLEKANKILVGSSYSFEILYLRAKKFIADKLLYAIGKPTYITMINKSFTPRGYFEKPSIYEILDILLNDREDKFLLKDI